MAAKNQIGGEQVHPVSLLDIWSPKGLVPEQCELTMRRLAVEEAAKLPEDCPTIDAVLIVCERLREVVSTLVLTTGTGPGADQSPSVTQRTGLWCAGALTTLWSAAPQI